MVFQPSQNALGHKAFQIGHTSVWLDRRLIRRDGKDHSLQPKAIEVLELLASRAGEAVSREELLSGVWGPDGSDDLLSNAVWKLRKALGDCGSEPPGIIETIPKFGYRLTRIPQPMSRPATRVSRRLWIPAALFSCAAVAGIFGWPGVEQSRPLVEQSVHVLPLVRIAGVKSGPSYSPDGQSVAYVAPDNSYHTDLFIYDRGTGESRRISSDSGWNFHPAFNRLGQVAVFRHLDGGCAIDVFDSRSGDRLSSFDCDGINGRSLNWSRDAQYLLVASHHHGRSTPVAIDTRTGKRVALADGGDHQRSLSAPAESPDGIRIAAIESLHEGGERVFIDESRTSPVYSRIGAMAWLGNDMIVFSVDGGDGTYHLLRWPADASADPALLARIPGTNTQISVDAVSNDLAFDATRSVSDLWMIDEPASGGAMRIASTAMDEYHPVIRPDGQRIAWLADQPRPGSVWVRDLPTGPGRHLDFVGLTVHSATWIGQEQLVVAALREGNHDLYRIDLGARSFEPLVATDAHEMAPSAAGRWVFYSSRSGTQWTPYRLDLDTNEITTLSAPGLRIMRPAPDGSRIYYTRNDADGLWTYDLETGLDSLVTDELGGGDWGNWAADSKGVVFISRFRGGNRLVRINHGDLELDRGAPYTGYFLPGANLSMSHQHQVAVTIRNNFEGDILMLQSPRPQFSSVLKIASN
ncbi:MAG: winged helix-turn-helix domain-containing protein [Xanthomonadales bacterium]|nr:winged helix-turn-helix domain-containing protein [Xanthomonadales bacterium]